MRPTIKTIAEVKWVWRRWSGRSKTQSIPKRLFAQEETCEFKPSNIAYETGTPSCVLVLVFNYAFDFRTNLYKQ
jgi:hypothetical protein